MAHSESGAINVQDEPGHTVIAERKKAIKESGQKDTRFLWPKTGQKNINRAKNCNGFKHIWYIRTYQIQLNPFVYLKKSFRKKLLGYLWRMEPTYYLKKLIYKIK